MAPPTCEGLTNLFHYICKFKLIASCMHVLYIHDKEGVGPRIDLVGGVFCSVNLLKLVQAIQSVCTQVRTTISLLYIYPIVIDLRMRILK